MHDTFFFLNQGLTSVCFSLFKSELLNFWRTGVFTPAIYSATVHLTPTLGTTKLI